MRKGHLIYNGVGKPCKGLPQAPATPCSLRNQQEGGCRPDKAGRYIGGFYLLLLGRGRSDLSLPGPGHTHSPLLAAQEKLPQPRTLVLQRTCVQNNPPQFPL